jgi:hypothetical protein
MMRFLAIALLAFPFPALAQQAAPKVGDSVEILRQNQTSQQSEGSSSASSGTDGLIERVTAVRPDGVELEYDVPPGSDGGWQFPVRVFRPLRGPLQLVDAKALETRVDAWLRQGGMTRAACGHWVMSWNAFRIECDPQSVLKTVEAVQIEPAELREGAPFTMPGARGSAPLVKKGNAQFTVELAIDADAARRDRAESDLAAAEINGEKLTPEAARRAHAGDAISGTLAVTFDLDANGHVSRRTTISKVQIKRADGRIQTNTVSEIVERRAKAKPPRDPNMI